MSDHDNLPCEMVAGRDIAGHPLNPDRVYTVKVYDFRRPDKFSREQIRTLSSIHEDAAKQIAAYLQVRLNCSVTGEEKLVDQCTLGESIEMTGRSGQFIRMKMDPLPGAGMAFIPAECLSALIERALGGEIHPDEVTAFDSLQETVLGEILRPMLGCLADAWRPVIHLEPVLDSFSRLPGQALPLSEYEMVIIIRLSFSFAGITVPLSLVYPFLTLEPIIPRLTAEQYYSPAKPEGSLTGARLMRSVPATITYVSPVGSVPLKDLPALVSGKRIPLTGNSIGLCVNGCEVIQLKRDDDTLTVKSDSLTESGRKLLGLVSQNRVSESALLRNEVRTELAFMKKELASIRGNFDRLARNQNQLEDQFAFGESIGASHAPGFEPGSLSGMNPADAESLSIILGATHPQISAVVLAHLLPPVAGSVLDRFEPSLQPGLVERIAGLRPVDPSLVKSLSAQILDTVHRIRRVPVLATSGAETVAGILNHVRRSTERHIINSLDTTRPVLSESIKQRMFVFEDIVLVAPGSVLALMDRIDRNDLVLAMKTVPEEVRTFLFSILGPEEAAKLGKAITSLGKVRLTDVDQAQIRIVEALKTLDEEGLLVLHMPGETAD